MIALMNGIKTGLALSELAIFRQPGLSSHMQEDLFEYPVRALGQTGVYLDSKKAWLYTFFSRRLSIDFSHEQRA